MIIDLQHASNKINPERKEGRKQGMKEGRKHGRNEGRGR